MNEVLDTKDMKRIVLLEDTGLYLKKGMKGYLRDEDTAYLDYENGLVGSGFVLNTFVDGNEYVPYDTEGLRYEIIEEELQNMWAVVLSGMLRKVDIVNLNNYEEWQLKSFNTLDDGEGNRVWYIDREDAVDFVIKNFDKSMIEPSIVLESDLNKNGCRFIYGTKRG